MPLEGNDANSIFIPFGFDPPVHASNVSARSKKRSPRDRFVNFDFNHQLARLGHPSRRRTRTIPDTAYYGTGLLPALRLHNDLT